MTYENEKRQLAAERGQALERCEELNALAERERRDLTDAEHRQFTKCLRAANLAAEKMTALEPMNTVPPQYSSQGTRAASTPALWMDSRGEAVFALSPQHKLADLPSDTTGSHQDRLSLGNAVRAVATGDWQRFAPRELQALGENSNAGGGFLVPSQLSRNVIDLARAKSAVINAGAITVPMESDRLTIAKVTTDPTMQVKTEGAAFTGSDPVFGAVNLTAYTIGTYVTISRELAADAANISTLVEQVLSNALAAEIDRQAIAGTGSQEWNGLIVNADVGSTSSVGAIAWEDLATAVVDIQGNNYEPNAYISSPTIAGDLAVLTSGDGANSAKLWLNSPRNVEPLTALTTTNCADANLYVGQWDQFIFGIRQEAMLEMTTEGGDAFTKHQLLIKVTFRGDVAVAQPGAFHRLDGITT